MAPEMTKQQIEVWLNPRPSEARHHITLHAVTRRLVCLSVAVPTFVILNVTSQLV